MSIDKFYMFDNNFTAIILLLMLFMIILIKKDIYDYPRKLFYRMIIINITLLIVEILAWAFDGITTEAAIIFNYTFNVLLILFEPIMASMWISYVDYKIYGSIKRLRRKLYYFQVPIFAGILLIINIFSPVAFSIDSNNIYHRGPLLWLSLLFVFALVLYTVFLALKNRKRISDQTIIFIAIFAFLPVLVSFIQLFVYGLILTWVVVALGIVFAYYLLEIAGNSKDYLTGLYSRKKIEEVLRGRIELKKPFSAISIDLEFFKEINDQYGHHAGDEILIHFAKILYLTFEKKNFVSRIGGDEFFIILEETELQNVLIFKQKIQEIISDYDDCEIIKEIGFSFGASVFKNFDHLTLDSVLTTVDKLMYIDKKNNKSCAI